MAGFFLVRTFFSFAVWLIWLYNWISKHGSSSNAKYIYRQSPYASLGRLFQKERTNAPKLLFQASLMRRQSKHLFWLIVLLLTPSANQIKKQESICLHHLLIVLLTPIYHLLVHQQCFCTQIQLQNNTDKFSACWWQYGSICNSGCSCNGAQLTMVKVIASFHLTCNHQELM